MAQTLKVDKRQFETVISNLLNAPEMPLKSMPRTRKPKRKLAAKRRG